MNTTVSSEPTLSAGGGVALVEHWLAGGEIVPAQLPSPSVWTAEKKLAAAVLRDALVSLRDYCGDWTKKRTVVEDFNWVFSNDTSWPYAFVPLCDLFGIEPAWVRLVVRRWQQLPCRERVIHAPRFRHAA